MWIWHPLDTGSYQGKLKWGDIWNPMLRCDQPHIFERDHEKKNISNNCRKLFVVVLVCTVRLAHVKLLVNRQTNINIKVGGDTWVSSVIHLHSGMKLQSWWASDQSGPLQCPVNNKGGVSVGRLPWGLPPCVFNKEETWPARWQTWTTSGEWGNNK